GVRKKRRIGSHSNTLPESVKVARNGRARRMAGGAKRKHASTTGSLLSPPQRIAQLGGGFVLFFGDGLRQLFLQRRLDVVELPQRPVHLPQLLDHAVLFHMLLRIEGCEEGP